MIQPPFELQQAIYNAGYVPPKHIMPGGITRFPRQDKGMHDNAGWCYCNNNLTHACFGDWVTDDKYSWHRISGDYDSSFNDSDRTSLRRQFATDLIENNTQSKAIATSKRAKSLWEASIDVIGSHPYVERKMIYPHSARLNGNHLLLAIRNFDNELCSLQYISPEGKKRFLSGGRTAGGYIHVFGDHSDPIHVVIAEGWATACSLVDTFPEALIIAALNCGNLIKVAKGARGNWPTVKITIASDDDQTSDRNIGIEKATSAAQLIGAKLIKPNWPKGVPKSLSDFNDLHCWMQGGCHD